MSSAESEVATPPDPVAIGDVIDNRLRVERIIGNGAIGVVVEATHLELKERVALKFLRPTEKTRKEHFTRFAREARAAARLRGEHIARVLDVGALPTGDPFMVMELLEGCDLEQHVTANGPILNLASAARYMIQACEALAEAHSLDIVHRDIKPANLFLCERAGALPMIKLLDFGISKAALTGEYTDVALAETKTTTIMGTPYYMAPEQILSTKDVDRRADIWALGTVMFELLTGQTMWRSEDLGALVQEILHGDPIPILELRPDLGPAFASALGGALQKDLDKRYATAAEFAAALLPFAPATSQVHVERAIRFASATPAAVPTLRTGTRKEFGPTSSSSDLDVATEPAPASRILSAAIGLSVLIILGTATAIFAPRFLAAPPTSTSVAPPESAAPPLPTIHVAAPPPPATTTEASPPPTGAPSPTFRSVEPLNGVRRPPATAPKLTASQLAPTDAVIAPSRTAAPPAVRKPGLDDDPWQKNANGKPKLEDDPFKR